MVFKNSKLIPVELAGPMLARCVQVYKKGKNTKGGVLLTKVFVIILAWNLRIEELLCRRQKIASIEEYRLRFRQQKSYGYIVNIKRWSRRQSGHYVLHDENRVLLVDSWNNFKIENPMLYVMDKSVLQIENEKFQESMYKWSIV